MAQCTAHLRNGSGTRCKKQAMKGQTVCGSHGGQAPQNKAAAARRLLESIDPAAAELVRIALKGKTERDRLTAIKELFERAGFGEAKRIQAEGELTITINGVDLNDLR